MPARAAMRRRGRHAWFAIVLFPILFAEPPRRSCALRAGGLDRARRALHQLTPAGEAAAYPR
jgi:hypothetical protein